MAAGPELLLLVSSVPMFNMTIPLASPVAATFPCLSAALSHVPLCWPVSPPGAYERYIRPVVPYEDDMTMLKWFVGNCLVDQ